MKDSQRLRGLRLSVAALGLLAWMLLGAWAGVASTGTPGSLGRNLVAEGRTDLLDFNRLGPAVVRLVELDDASGQVSLDGQVFADSTTLIDYLSAQPRSWFSEGILMVFSGKEDVRRDLYNAVIGFCVANDYDLFSKSPVSKAGLQDQVVWVVQSSTSLYLPVP